MRPLASRPPMKILSLLSVCTLALFSNACEKQPLAGDPAPGVHAEPSAEKHETKAGGEAEHAKPAEGAKSDEAPKFFPEKK